MSEEITEEKLWVWMRIGQYPPLIDELGTYAAHKQGVYGLARRAHATLSCDYGKLKRGTRVNVVMASRLGDVGITTDLNASRGYSERVICVESEFCGVKREPTGVLIDIVPIEDSSERVKKAFPEGAVDITDVEW